MQTWDMEETWKIKRKTVVDENSAVKTFNFPTHKGFCHNFPTKTQYYHTHKNVTKALLSNFATFFSLLPTSYLLPSASFNSYLLRLIFFFIYKHYVYV